MDDFEIFDGKSYEDLMKDIYDNHERTKHQIKTLINKLDDLVDDIDDATIIVPMIKEYLDIGIQNDEHLVKMAKVVQRIMTSKNSGKNEDVGYIPEDERKELMEEVKKMKEIEDNNRKMLSDKGKEKVRKEAEKKLEENEDV